MARDPAAGDNARNGFGSLLGAAERTFRIGRRRADSGEVNSGAEEMVYGSSQWVSPATPTALSTA
jgi:hypothetical protein